MIMETQLKPAKINGLSDAHFDALHAKVALAACNALDPRYFGFNGHWDAVLDCFDQEYLKRYGSEDVSWGLQSGAQRIQGLS